MSNESFKAFMARVNEDEGLREKLRAAGGDDGLSLQALAEFAGAHGHAFSVEDVTSELSDAQLGAVAGGLTTAPLLFGKASPHLTFYKLGGSDLMSTHIKLT